MDNNIFKEKYSDLFTTFGYGVDTIQHILHSIGFTYQNLNSTEAKQEALMVIEQLLKNNIICVTYWGKHNEIIKNLNLTIKQTLLYIQSVWKDDMSLIDFEEIINFKYQEWYLDEIKRQSIDIDTDWDWFKKDFVPKIRNWINDKKPKD